MTKKTPTKLINTTPLEFSALSDVYREYDYIVEGRKFTITVPEPRFLNVNLVHGAHRILDSRGIVHYLPGNFIALRWFVEEGTPHFHTTVAQPDGSRQQVTYTEDAA